jgi:cell division protein FtsI/penicillin-binding protein 2/cell division protein FtsW (lipid II flippase)
MVAVAVTSPAGTAAGLRGAAGTLVPLYLAGVGAHALLWLLRVESDPLLLPLLSLLLMIGGIYHQGIGRAGGGTTADAYLLAALVGVAVLALLVAAAPLLRRLALRFEEVVWWRVAGDAPYYASLPFHLLLLGGMAVLLLWLRLFGRADAGLGGAIVQAPLPFGGSFTPSEFVRLAVAFFLAEFLATNARVMRTLRQPLGRRWPLNRIFVEHAPELIVVLTMLLLYCAFFYLFRDFGPAVVIVALTLLCLFAATGRLGTPLTLAGLALLAVGLPSYLGWGFRTLQQRVAMWWDPFSTDFAGGDHLARALWGIASGGWLGLGVGSVNLRSLLPEAARDTVFAGIATTMGVWVAAVVLALYAALTWRGFCIARAAGSDHGRLLAFSMTALLALQAFWICAASVRILPLSGINLPFLSTGISSMIASFVPVAVLLHLSRGAPSAGEEAEGITDASGDASGSSTPQVARGVERLARPVTLAFALPLVGLLAYGAPFLLGDRTLVRPALAVGGDGERAEMANPYLAGFRARFPRGRILAADGTVLAANASSGPARRRYPLGVAGAQLVGWTTSGRFAAARESVESLYDSDLRGYREADLPHLWRTRHNPLARKPEPRDVTLTLTGDLQRDADRRLQETVRQTGGAGGAAILFDATTGRVLAAATAPRFDPNGLTRVRMERYAREHRQSLILAHKGLSREAQFFPGSIFKLLTAAAALEDPSALEGSVVCRAANGEPITWAHKGRRYRRKVGALHDYGMARHGAWNLETGLDRALAVSCNVFFATLATRVGPERLAQTLRSAGLAVAPGPDRLAEYLPEAGFGQIVVRVSPIEMARLAGAIGRAQEGEADEGQCPEPYWVEKIGAAPAPRGRTGSPGERPYQPFSPEVARRLRAMMRGVVESPSGTAYRAFHDPGGGERLPHLEIGGKTGTAEFDKQVTTRSGRRARARGKHAWFVGFARERDRVPARVIAFAVLVEDVRGRATGGAVCAPLARDLLARALPRGPGDGAPARDGDGWIGRFLDRVDRGVDLARRILGR